MAAPGSVVNPRSLTRRAIAFTGILLMALSGPVAADEAAAYEIASAGGDLTELSLDQLMSIEVTSVSKRSEAAGSAAAALYVLTGDDIRRSGAHSIAEALRMV